MKIKFNLLDIDLHLFDGAGGAGAAGGEGASGAMGETNSTPASTQQGKTGDTQKVIYGKQHENAEAVTEQHSAAGSDGKQAKGDEPKAGSTMEERRQAFRQMVTSEEFKDIYAEETQRMINRRFSQTKTLEHNAEMTQPILDILSQRYGVTAEDISGISKALQADDDLLAQEAEDAGMTIEQRRQFRQLEIQNQQLQREKAMRTEQDNLRQKFAAWHEEEMAMKQKYPGFDLNTEAQNPYFKAMMNDRNKTFTMEQAYRFCHMQEFQEAAAKATEKQIVDNIRAAGQRPTENGATSSQSAFITKSDPRKWTKKDRAEVRRRVEAGEKIYL